MGRKHRCLEEATVKKLAEASGSAVMRVFYVIWTAERGLHPHEIPSLTNTSRSHLYRALKRLEEERLIHRDRDEWVASV